MRVAAFVIGFFGNTRRALNGMRRMHLYWRRGRKYVYFRTKGKREGKRKESRRKLPLISQWHRGRVIDTPWDDRYNVESISSTKAARGLEKLYGLARDVA